MELILTLIDFVLHVDRHLTEIVASFGSTTYAILAGILFCETGLVVTPFLPGDSLLFATGALSGAGLLDPFLLMTLLPVAVIIGDNVNYAVGRYVGPEVFAKDKVPFIKKKHLNKAHAFYEKHGGKTIIMARFVPIVRTFAPFVAGAAGMSYTRFLTFSMGGGLFWIAFFLGMGYFFGNMPIIRKNFSVAIYVIIVLSVLPAVFEIWRERRKLRAEA